ncbi:MAG: hypothetical protein HYU81_02425 [Candidatus Brennerbacteria bacterium]|nr:hypothetical protein [Candidatus Brennerbacteria bacterium]
MTAAVAAVVCQTLESGKAFMNASSTAIVRPWLQDFDIGATYDVPMVRAEIQAVKDVGAEDTWMIWNPANVYEWNEFLPAIKRARVGCRRRASPRLW